MLRQIQAAVKEVMGRRFFPQSQWWLSRRPLVNLCWLRSDLPTLIFLSKNLPFLLPIEKCLYLGCSLSLLKYSLYFYTEHFLEGYSKDVQCEGKKMRQDITGGRISKLVGYHGRQDIMGGRISGEVGYHTTLRKLNQVKPVSQEPILMCRTIRQVKKLAKVKLNLENNELSLSLEQLSLSFFSCTVNEPCLVRPIRNLDGLTVKY